ncbi:MAG TPA: hypothetical protein VFW73_10980 [Lacipirellulaceae bacterium]|nr:hypothetical protein [Lacipirellulaceae bacterium]
MGIRFSCPNGHKLNVKEFLAGKRGVCPQCGAKFVIPMQASATESEVRRSDGGGQSQTIEIASPMAGTTSTFASSPQGLEAPANTDVAPQSDWESAAIGGPEPVAPTHPALEVATVQPLANATPIATASSYTSRREQNRAKQLAISIVLLLIVIVLAIVLVIVFRHNLAGTPATKTTAVFHGTIRQMFTVVNTG